jgi:hypothetical protein
LSQQHPIDDLRLEVVGIRAELRAARQDLARRRRAVMRGARLTSRTVKEREVEMDLLVHEDAEVVRLEDTILKLQHQEDLRVAQLESAQRAVQEYQWFVRERMADSNGELAVALSSSPLAHMVQATVSAYGERSSYVGGSHYMHERELE